MSPERLNDVEPLLRYSESCFLLTELSHIGHKKIQQQEKHHIN